MFNFSINERTIDINEIDELIGEINLIDIREPHEFKCGTLRTAKNIPMDTLLNNPDKNLDTSSSKLSSSILIALSKLSITGRSFSKTPIAPIS